MNIVFLDDATIGNVSAIEKIKAIGNYTSYDFTNPEEVVERLKDADVAIVNKIEMTREIISSLPSLKLICISATGTNNIDHDAAKEHGVIVKNVAGYSTNSVAQTTFSLLFQLMCNIPYFDNYVKSGSYSKSRSFTVVNPTYNELNGKIFGIVGLGNIGRKVALIAEAFGAKVIYYSTSGANSNPDYRRVDMDTLLRESDIISIHAPMNERTNNLFDYAKLKQMKSTAYILNMGRGGIINEADLARVIDEELIAGAGIDVFVKEPIAINNPLINVKNKERLALSPHIAWASVEARELLMELLYDNIVDWNKTL